MNSELTLSKILATKLLKDSLKGDSRESPTVEFSMPRTEQSRSFGAYFLYYGLEDETLVLDNGRRYYLSDFAFIREEKDRAFYGAALRLIN